MAGRLLRRQQMSEVYRARAVKSDPTHVVALTLLPMTKLFRIALFACAAIALNSTAARADSIGPDCATCQGSIYTLDFVQAGTDLFADGFDDTYLVTLTIDTTTYNGGGDYIDQVAVKISSGVDSAQLVSAPTDLSNWTLLAGGISASGCSGSGAGFECADLIGSGSASVDLGTLTWTFLIDVSSPLFSFDGSTELPTIKARYVDDSGKKVGSLVSEKVPEPGTLVLLGIGLSLAAIRRRARA